MEVTKLSEYRWEVMTPDNRVFNVSVAPSGYVVYEGTRRVSGVTMSFTTKEKAVAWFEKQWRMV